MVGTPARIQALVALLLAGVVGLWSAGCGSGYADHTSKIERRRDKIRRNALLVRGPSTLEATVGAQLMIPLVLTVAEGFYVPSHSASQRSLMPAWLELPDNRFARVDGVTYPPGKLVDLPGQELPVEVHDGTVQWTLRLGLHPALQPGERALTAKVHYQLCTVNGCEMPEVRPVRIVLDVRAAKAP